MATSKSVSKQDNKTKIPRKIGTIYSSPVDNSPNTNHFLFIIDEHIHSSDVCQGMFCSTESDEGLVIGRIEEIFVKNEYYANPQTVKNFEQGDFSNISTYFPSDKWEDYLAYAKVLGVFPRKYNTKSSKKPAYHKILKRSYFPAKPGSKVQLVEDSMLEEFLGLDQDGLNLGDLEHYNIPIKLNLSRLINKHVAILAMSGAGKSRNSG